MNNATKSELKHHEICPLDSTLAILSGKWKSIILCRLMNKDLHFNELSRSINKCSRRMLALQLKQLINDDIVKKNVMIKDQTNVTTYYSLTHLGKSLVPLIKEMDKWGENYIKKEQNK
ncbi:winged helix-turn-helix transcriptional regulator [Fructilactobacillus carniphilus]|uniref:Helix-turn-helix transcriptional regulator n=1 Tax=Fructilactobacillus carniphilus TaxID=2940297 RepID=A0ABY5BXQ4_9LACO|nr:helix-turn-helix domain-containing protein [Fructilactobacillus carniphilus]USS91299.1 helix-turn-helix transcriptional regulator [Fructilactobacillus carniphilus]